MNTKREISIYGAFNKAQEMGVDFENDYHAQSFGNELSDLAKEVGYRKPKNANGSTGRYFFEYLRKLRDRFKW